jgi:hypothetical protein
MMKVIFVLAAMGLSLTLNAQRVGLKNSVLADATLSPNLALEISLGKHHTLELYGSYNPFKLKEEKKFKHWMALPELRLWTCERFNGYFFGLHALAGEFNVANLELPGGILHFLEGNRFEGLFYGGGLSVGHQWILGRRWNAEAVLGAGFVQFRYDKFTCGKCAPRTDHGTYNYLGITRAALSIVYFIR